MNDKAACNGDQKHSNSGVTPTAKPARVDKINMDFDHLSVVSEECLSNNGDPANGYAGVNSVDAAMLSGFQSTVPPLTHFENLSYKDIGPNLGAFTLQLLFFFFFSFLKLILFIVLDSLPDTADEATPPPPTPPLQTDSNRQSDGSLPFPPPPASSKEASPEIPERSVTKFIRFPQKSKSKHPSDPDLCVSNAVATESSRLATIRKPHNPLKCPSGSKQVGLVVIIRNIFHNCSEA